MWQVIGQEKAVHLLKRSLEKDAFAHAFIFSGPPHVGKMTLAVDMARALNCEAGDSPCGECSSCRRIIQGKHADVQVINLENSTENDETRKATEISIKRIRQLQHSASLPPFEGKYKIFIIDEAELLSTEAANCLLKTLEEPEERIVFILLTGNTEMLLQTVVSRCQKLALSPMPAEDIAAKLKNTYAVEAKKAKLLSRLCYGCIGWAISAALDDKIIEQYFEDRQSILEITDGSCEERFAYAEKLARQFSQKRKDTQRILQLWLDIWRDLLLVKSGSASEIINIDIEEKINEMAEGYSLGDIRRFIGGIQAADRQLKRNANPRLVLEVLMLDIPGKIKERVESQVCYGRE